MEMVHDDNRSPWLLQATTAVYEYKLEAMARDSQSENLWTENWLTKAPQILLK